MPYFTQEEIANLIKNFKNLWSENSHRYFVLTDKDDLLTQSVSAEFYHGGCNYFATALAVILGLENTKVYKLYHNQSNGSREFIHAIVEYLPHNERTFNEGHYNDFNHPVDITSYDIQSCDGRAFEQANYVFLTDPCDNQCPFLPPKFPEEEVVWEMESTDKINAMIEEYKSLNTTDSIYWTEIYHTLKKCLDDNILKVA